MLRKLLVLVTVPFLFASVAFAQGTLTGTVTDAETGDPIPGANVYIEELERGSATDNEGSYVIRNIPSGDHTLRVTFVGYETYRTNFEISDGEEVVQDVSLETGAVGLDELVVTGYGVENKREVTGSISSVSSEEFGNVPVQNTESILQGRAAGVNVTTTSGNPGGAFRVNIRGNGSINAASEPLYIVDGVQMSFSQQSVLTSQSPLNSISPSDIESIEVLKDASAAAIYGSQAANGVVLITTKRGQEGATQITARSEAGVRQATQRVDYIGRDDYLDYLGEAAAINAGVAPVGDAGFDEGGAYLPYRDFYEDILLDNFGSPEWDSEDFAQYQQYLQGNASRPEGGLANTDWQDFIYGTGVSQKYNISASGGDDQTRFYISGQSENTDGHIFNSKYDKIGLRTNFDHQVNERLGTALNLNLSRTNQFGICQDGNFINCPPSQAMFENPFTFPFLSDGEYNSLTGFGRSNNPAVIRDEVERNVRVISLVGDFNANYQINDWLGADGFIGVDYRNTEDERFETPIADPGAGGSLAYDYRNVYNFNTNFRLNFRQTIDDIHNFSGFTGVEYRRDYSTRVGTTGQGFPGSFFKVLNTSSEPTEASGINSEFRLGGYFGNLKYNYDERYYLSLVARYDGHSRFGSETRFGFFPSVSGSWRISEEDFFNVDDISDLRLRAGYGVTGNAAIGNFAARGLYSAVGSYRGQTALTPTQLANQNLSWEEAQEINLGLEAEIFDGRITATIDAYRKDNDNLLLDRELPVESGFQDITENVGSIRNEGLEFEINTVNIATGDFSWSTRFNTGFLRNEVLDLGEDNILNENSTFEQIEVGRALGIIQVPEWAGVNPDDGRPMWYDADGNITYTPNAVEDSKIYKDGIANMTGGFGNSFGYKGLSLDIFFQFSFGQWAFANTDYYFTRTPDFLMNLDDIVMDRWREPGDVTYFPRAVTAGGNFAETSNFRTTLGTQSIYNASYIRLKDVTLGYNLPSSITNRLNLRGVRVFATGLNLHTWTAWPFYDPEVAADTDDIYGNLVAASYPTAMQINGGIEIQF